MEWSSWYRLQAESAVRFSRIAGCEAEPLFTISTPLGDLNFTNSMLFTLIVVVALALFARYSMRKVTLVPRGAQNVAEAVVEFLLGLVEGTAGEA